MKRDKIDDCIKHFYEKQALSSEMLTRLSALQKNQHETAPQELLAIPEKKFLHSHRRVALAASLVLMLITGIQFGYIFKATEDDLILRVSQEVELNHNKQLATEFVTNSYSTLATTMNKLDFKLTAPKHLSRTSYQLLGARYCSIQGQIAAQLKLLNSQGDNMTLYVTRINDELASLNNKNQLREGLLIQNWHENELFFSLATPQNQAKKI